MPVLGSFGDWMSPDCISLSIVSAVSKASVMVVAITPTGPLFTHPLQYRPVIKEHSLHTSQELTTALGMPLSICEKFQVTQHMPALILLLY